jgi:hypothetical protein
MVISMIPVRSILRKCPQAALSNRSHSESLSMPYRYAVDLRLKLTHLG